MDLINQFKGKNVLVLGLAKTGYQVALLLLEVGANVTVNDAGVNHELQIIRNLEQKGAQVITGFHPDNLVDEKLDYIIKNPGIPYTNALIQKAQTYNIPILTDVELAYYVAQAPIIGITGTNGKTTTTMLTAKMLEERLPNQTTYIAGNIGVSSIEVAKKATKDDLIVMELSSFQLAGTRLFKPSIAVITNTFSAHIDYHQTREEYVAAKLNILKNQTSEDCAIFNRDLDESVELAQHTKGKVYYFSKHDSKSDAYEKNGKIIVLGEEIFETSIIKLPGEHNLENILAATLIAKLEKQSNEAIIRAVEQFTGVKHRTQFVKEVNGRLFYNDSKATNSLATKMALSGFDNEKVILIAGGLDRGGDFSDLQDSLRRLQGLVVYGQTKHKLKEAGEYAEVAHIVLADTLEEATQKAYDMSRKGDAILLSPACASWDQFENFEVRGDAFIKKVESFR